MSLAELLAEAFAAMRRNKLRSFLTLLGIVIGVATLVGVVSVISGLNTYVRDKLFALAPDVYIVTKFGIIREHEEFLEALKRPLVVGLYASPERIVQIRENRLLGLKAHRDDDIYIDKSAVAEEVAFSRKLCAKHNWPSIDVTRRSIEETAAAVMKLLAERRRAPGK